MSKYHCSLLLVDDEPLITSTLTHLVSSDFQVISVTTAEAAQRIFAEREIDVILADQKLPGMTGVSLLEWVRQHSPRTIRLLMTGLAKLEDAVAAINYGQVHRFIFKPFRAEELQQTLRNAARTFLLERSHEELLEELRRLNLELERRVQQRTRELEVANHQLEQKNMMLEKLALTDPLTGLPNRRAIDRVARTELRRRARYSAPVALGVVDVDHFKEINNRYLLPGGDQVLISLAQVLIGALRTVDTIGRIGGEEFLVVAPATGVEGAGVLAERIRSTVEASPIPYKRELIHVTVSVGFATAEAGIVVEYDQMKDVASRALAQAKNTGRNRSVITPAPTPLDQVG